MSLNKIKLFVQKINGNQTFRNSILFTFFSFLNNGISFILLIILAKFISPDGYGALNLFNTLIVLGGILITLSSHGYISISYFKKTYDDFRKILNSVFIIATSVFVIILILQVLFSIQLEQILGISSKYQLIGILICFFQVFNTVNLDIWRLEEKPIKYGLYGVSIAILNLIITLIFVITLNYGWIGRIYAQLSVAVVFFLISLIFLIKRKYLVWSMPDVALIKEALYFGMPLVPHLASGWARQGLDRYIVNHFYDVTDVGFFSFAFNFANIILIVGTAFNASNSVFIFKSLANYSFSVKRKLLKQTKLMIFFFVLFALFVLIGSFIFIYKVTPQYIESLIYLFPLCLSLLIQSIYLLYVNYLFYYKKTKVLMYITFSVSILHVGMSYVLTPYSIQLTAYTSVISSFLIFILVFIYAHKLLKKQPDG